MAGLGAARVLETARLAGSALDWLLIESEPRLGGKVRTVRREGFVIEGGPDSAIVEKPWPIEAARELGIGDRLLDSNEDIRKSFVYSRGRLHEFPEGIVLMVPTRIVPFALSSLISWPGKLRMGMDLVLPRGREVDDESLGDFVRRRLGREALAKVAEPIVAGIHAGDPEQMSVRATFPMFHEMERRHRSLIVGMLQRRRARAAQTARAQGVAGGGGVATAPRTYFYSFRTGLADLSDAIGASLPAERLRLGTAVRSLTIGRPAPPAAGPAASGPRYELALADGSRELVDAVVLAAPAFVAGALLQEVAPGAARELESIAYVSTATVSLTYRREQVAHPLRGFGVVVPRAESRDLMAVTWSSSKFAGRAPDGHVLVRGFLGRAGLEQAVQLDDEEMLAVVRRELADIMGIAAPPGLTEVFRWPQGMPQYRVGHAALVERIEAAVAAVPGVEVAGGAYHGIGIGDCLREGASAAERVLAHLRGLPEAAAPSQAADTPAGDGVDD
jgi:oxygen-dependent protoporphyrinogen oxidase